MQVPKPSEADKAHFRTLVPVAPDIEVKPMFGNLGAFVGGNMFMGLFGPDVGVRLAPDDLKRLTSMEGWGPFGPPERPMGGWLTLPFDVSAHDASVWVGRALEFVRSMPPKTPKTPKGS